MANLTTIQLKRSITADLTPTNLLANGELAVNLLDKRLFTTNTTGGAVFDAVQNVATSFSITGTTVTLTVGNSTINVVSNSSILKVQNSTVVSSISIQNVVTTNVYAGFLATGNIVAASQLGPSSNSTNFLRGDLTWAAPTATAAPGGSNTQIQYNDSAVLAGDADFTFDKATNIVVLGNTTTGNFKIGSGADPVSFTNSTVSISSNSTVNLVMSVTGLSIPVTNSTGNIAVPAGNSLAYHVRYKAGRIVPTTIDPNGEDTVLQQHFGHKPQGYLLPIPGGTTVSALRMTSANTIAFTSRTPASGNTFLSSQRIAQTTGATAGTSISWRNSVLQYWRGNAAGLGGFYAVARFGVAIPTTNGRGYVGFKDSATILSNGAPSAQTNIIGFGWDSSNATVNTLRAMSANSTVANTIDLGSGFPVNVGNTNWYEAVIYAPPNGGTVSYQVTNLKNGNTVTGSYNQTNLPTTTTFLTWQFWGNNGADASAEAVDWGGVTIEARL